MAGIVVEKASLVEYTRKSLCQIYDESTFLKQNRILKYKNQLIQFYCSRFCFCCYHHLVFADTNVYEILI